MDVMCRRRHRNARRIGAASHRRDIKAAREALEHDAALIRWQHLWRVYERDWKAFSISYAVLLIFGRMGKLQFTASAVFSLLGSAVGALVKFLGSSWDGSHRRYRPENHYMRGPGPKWREKNM